MSETENGNTHEPADEAFFDNYLEAARPQLVQSFVCLLDVLGTSHNAGDWQKDFGHWAQVGRRPKTSWLSNPRQQILHRGHEPIKIDLLGNARVVQLETLLRRIQLVLRHWNLSEQPKKILARILILPFRRSCVAPEPEADGTKVVGP